MSDAWISPTVFTIFWGVVGIIAPFFVRGPNSGVIRTILVETAACCYLFYLCTWLMQLHPLIGPQLTNNTLLVMRHQWG